VVPESVHLGQPVDPTPIAEPQPQDARSPEQELALAQQRWPDVLERIQARKPLVAAQFSTSRPARVEDGSYLVISFQTPFDKKRAERPENRQVLEDEIEACLGHRFKLRCVVGDGGGMRSLFDDPVVNFAVSKFGGEPRLLDPPTS
jgi:hypothetical protein